MLEVVPGSSHTGTVIRGLQIWEVNEFVFPCSMLYKCCVERENVDIDLVHFNLFFYVRKGLYNL